MPDEPMPPQPTLVPAACMFILFVIVCGIILVGLKNAH